MPGPASRPADLPLLLDPGAVLQRRLVRRGVVGREGEILQHLPDEGGLARLARSGQDLDESPGFREPFPQSACDKSFVHTRPPKGYVQP